VEERYRVQLVDCLTAETMSMLVGRFCPSLTLEEKPLSLAIDFIDSIRISLCSAYSFPTLDNPVIENVRIQLLQIFDDHCLAERSPLCITIVASVKQEAKPGAEREMQRRQTSSSGIKVINCEVTIGIDHDRFAPWVSVSGEQPCEKPFSTINLNPN
jgi:hypothetical protein